MSTVFFHSFLFIFIIYSNGLIFLKKLLKSKIEFNFYEISLIGLFFTLIISPLINFFIPLNDTVIIVNFIFSLAFLLFNKKIFFKGAKVNLKIFFLTGILVLVNIYGSNFSDDLEHYHYGSITNFDELNSIWGNSFLHPLYGTTSLWLMGHSYFNFDHSRLIDIHVLNGLLLFLILSLLLNEILSKEKKFIFFKHFIFALLTFILIKYTRLKEFGIDRPAILLFCFSIYFYLKYILVGKKNDLLKNFILLFSISIAIISIKIIYLPILIFPFLVFFQFKKELFKINYNYLFIFFFIFIFFFKSLISTGCLIFPFEISCLKFLSWSNHLGAIEFSFSNEVFNKSWTSYTGNLDKIDFIKNFNWFETWFNRGKIEILEYFLIIILIIFITYFLFQAKSTLIKKEIYNLDILRVSLILIIFSSIFIYFYKNPVLRMNHHMLISLMILLISFFNINYKNKKNYIINIFLIFAFIFAFYKNFLRINDNEFTNNPKSTISSKIVKPYKKRLDNFEYSLGWYGSAPIGNQDIHNKKHVKFLIFDIISNK